MTDRIEYTFDLDGFVDEIRYYRSLTTIDINNPPPPTAVLDGSDRAFVDNTVTVNQTYHVVFSSVRNSIEKFSDEVIVVASSDTFDPFVISKLALSSDLIDEKSKTWTPNKTPVFQDNALLFDGSFRASSSDLITPNYNSVNYNIQCEIKPSRLDRAYQNVFAKRANNSTYAEFLLRLESNKLLITACSGSTWYQVKGNTVLATDRFYKVEMDRKGNTVTLYVDDLPDLNFTLPSPVVLNAGASASSVTIGALTDGADPYYGLMRNFKITHGSSRH